MQERSLIHAVNQLLQYWSNLRKLEFIRCNTGAVRIMRANGSTGFMKTGKRGVADFVVWLPKGRCIFLELKSDTGKQNFSQIEFQQMIEKLGYKYFIIKSLNEIMDLFKELEGI